MAKLIFGCGYLGERVARLWRDAGEEVFAVTRSSQRAGQLAERGISPIVADIAGAGDLPPLPSAKTVVFAVGYDRTGAGGPAGSIHEVYAGGARRAAQALPGVERFIYISSTGVYGQVAGEEVDETSPCRPTREGGKASLAAEKALEESPVARKVIILRLAGIYGPGRIPRSADLIQGKPIDAPAHGFLNLIHVDDVAQIVLLAEGAMPPRTYVVSDGHPVVRGDYYRELARLLSAPAPTFVEPPADSPAAQRAGSDKRVNPRRMMTELKPTLAYPSYREGLAAIVKAGG